jgi:trehalose 6-phosphate phosphatase
MRKALTAAEALAVTAPRAARSGFFFDFDGTLAPIQLDPAAAEPAPGVVTALRRLRPAVKRLAIVSARPVDFLQHRFEGMAGISIYGLYGLQSVTPGGEVLTDPAALAWVPVMRDLADRASRELPAAVLVEYKRVGVALHYRRAPRHRPVVEAWAEEQRARLGLVAQQGRMVVELKPPVERNKGTVIGQEIGDLDCAWYFGDDISDLLAFAALERRESAGDGFTGVRVAVANQETGGPLAEAADLVLDSPFAVPAFLSRVVDALLTGPED